ncbi:MAG: hypothetical protein HKM93_16330 [Desulfobacteraceae bacterium]|nr:hypothetical protein [Desulfobacteraceae bacterium]
MSTDYNENISSALGILRREIPALHRLLKLGDPEELRPWEHMIDGKLMPRLEPDFPLTCAICGGGSSGKSTLFNTLAGEKLSPTGGKAGINRRVLIAAHPAFAEKPAFLHNLYQPFGCDPTALSDKDQLTSPGDPVYTLASSVSPHIILLDTPDFDTGAKGVYANRALARQSLETADLLIYIFTNSNYNNRDNTDFISEMLTGIGTRQCMLIYRVYPGFSDADVTEHAMTVAENIYGTTATDNVLGIYRADEDNAVAAGTALMSIKPVRNETLSFPDALARIEPRRIRMALFSSILNDVLARAAGINVQAVAARHSLSVYVDALQAAQSRCVQEALSHFPMDRVMKRFAEIWLTTDPAHIRFLRKTGRIVETPVRWAVKSMRWIKSAGGPAPATPADTDADADLKIDLISAANRMFAHAVGTKVVVSLPTDDPVAQRMCHAMGQVSSPDAATQSEGFDTAIDQNGITEFSISAHPVLEALQTRLQTTDWKAGLQRILSERASLMTMTAGMEAELKTLADEFRRKMGILDQIQQTFSAMLNVLPATAAVTYILATGDPVGAAGIKVKLAGLFGLKDLYALVAIPATAGVKQADIKQLETMLGPIAETWLNTKMQTVQRLFEQLITGPIIAEGGTVINTAEDHIERINTCLQSLKGAAPC